MRQVAATFPPLGFRRFFLLSPSSLHIFFVDPHTPPAYASTVANRYHTLTHTRRLVTIDPVPRYAREMRATPVRVYSYNSNIIYYNVSYRIESTARLLM